MPPRYFRRLTLSFERSNAIDVRGWSKENPQRTLTATPPRLPPARIRHSHAYVTPMRNRETGRKTNQRGNKEAARENAGSSAGAYTRRPTPPDVH